MSQQKTQDRPAWPSLAGPSIFASDPRFNGANIRRSAKQTFGVAKVSEAAWGDGDMGPMTARGAKAARHRHMTPERLSVGPMPKKLRGRG